MKFIKEKLFYWDFKENQAYQLQPVNDVDYAYDVHIPYDQFDKQEKIAKHLLHTQCEDPKCKQMASYCTKKWFTYHYYCDGHVLCYTQKNLESPVFTPYCVVLIGRKADQSLRYFEHRLNIKDMPKEWGKK